MLNYIGIVVKLKKKYCWSVILLNWAKKVINQQITNNNQYLKKNFKKVRKVFYNSTFKNKDLKASYSKVSLICRFAESTKKKFVEL